MTWMDSRWLQQPYLGNLTDRQIAILSQAVIDGTVCPDDCRAHCHAPKRPRSSTAAPDYLLGCMRPRVEGSDTCKLHVEDYLSPRDYSVPAKHRRPHPVLPPSRAPLTVHELSAFVTNRLNGRPFIVTACQVSVPFGAHIFAVSPTYRAGVTCAGCISVAATGQTEPF